MTLHYFANPVYNRKRQYFYTVISGLGSPLKELTFHQSLPVFQAVLSIPVNVLILKYTISGGEPMGI